MNASFPTFRAGLTQILLSLARADKMENGGSVFSVLFRATIRWLFSLFASTDCGIVFLFVSPRCTEFNC